MDLYRLTLTVYGHEAGMPEASSGAPESENEANLYGVPTTSADPKELKVATVAEQPVAVAPAASPEHETTPWPDFDNRIDSVAVLLARQAPNLSVLVSARNSIYATNEVEITQFPLCMLITILRLRLLPGSW